MKTRRYWLLAIGLLAGLAAAQAPDPAEDAARLRSDMARLKREIQKADADLRRTDSLSHAESDAAAQNLERWRRDRERREKENQELGARVAQTRTKIAAEQTRLKGYLDGADELKARDKALLQTLSGFADSLRLRIENGPPWDAETRRDRLLSLQRDIQAGSASPEEAFGRLAAVLKEEVKGGDEIALFSRPVTLQNGEVINAQLMKIGNQTVVYMDEEGKKFGVLERRLEGGKPVFTWREDPDFQQKAAIKLALAVKAGREAPRLVPLEMPLSLDSASGKGGR